jgi:peptide deformylase
MKKINGISIQTDEQLLSKICNVMTDGNTIKKLDVKMRMAMLGGLKSKAVGLANNQTTLCGGHWRMFAMRSTKHGLITFVNPVIKLSGKKISHTHGCLSLKKEYKNEWYNEVEIYSDTEFEPWGSRGKFHFTGYESIVVQHEMDHLNGILINKKQKELI